MTHWLELQEYVRGAEEKEYKYRKNGVEIMVKITPVFSIKRRTVI